jgi:hypothetical protein
MRCSFRRSPRLAETDDVAIALVYLAQFDSSAVTTQSLARSAGPLYRTHLQSTILPWSRALTARLSRLLEQSLTPGYVLFSRGSR